MRSVSRRLVRAASWLIALGLLTSCVSAGDLNLFPAAVKDKPLVANSAPASGFAPAPVPRAAEPVAAPREYPPVPPAASGAVVIPPGAEAAGLDKIQHFVFILQENHSFDSYFGTYPGADGIPPGVCLPSPYGGCVAPFHNTSPVSRGGPHDWDNALADINDGQMNGFVTQAYDGVSKKSPAPCLPPQAKCAPGRDPRDVMGYYDYHEIPNYWNYAHLYVLQDHMFSAVTSYTLPNRLYMLAGQSGGLVKHAQGTPSSFDFPQVTQLLSEGKIDWKYYVTSGKQPDTEDGHVVGTGSSLTQVPHEYSLYNPLPAFEWIKTHPADSRRLVDTSQFYLDAQTGNLPQVCWVIPNDAVSEHSPSDTRVGMAYVTGLVDAVMRSPEWSSTAIFISYDEWGGYYDHVTPPRVDQYGYGVRVPGLVISPYARQDYVDHNVYSTDGWLKLLEERYGLPALTARDANAADMLADFDFNQAPRAPVILAPTLTGSPYPQPLQRIVEEGGQPTSPPRPKTTKPILPVPVEGPAIDLPSRPPKPGVVAPGA